MSNADYFIALGGNMGSVLSSFCEALTLLQAAQVRIQALSSVYASPAQGGPAQADYLNAVVSVQSSLEAEAMLQLLLSIEQQLGRVRLAHWGPRTLDLDLLAWGQCIHQSPSLSLPHPRMSQRHFVMLPLCDIAKAWRHPIAQKTAAQLLAELPLEGIALHDEQWPAQIKRCCSA